MNSYFFLYMFVSILSIAIGHFIWKKNKDISGYFFYFFVVFASVWYMLYFIFFSELFSDPKVLLYISRGAFLVGVLSVYSLVFFLKNFNSENTLFGKKELYIIASIYIAFGVYTMFSKGIISGLTYSDSDMVYREVYGSNFFLIPLLYAGFFVLFIYFGYFKSKALSTLSALRFKKIVFSACVFLFGLIFLQVFLPLFNIWILEKEIIFLYLFFVIYVFFSIKRYHFSPLHQEYGFIKIGISFFALLGSIATLNGIRYFFPSILLQEGGFWNAGDKFHIIDGSIIVIAYLILYRIFKKWLLINDSENEIKQHIDTLKQNISDTTDMESLNKVLQRGMQSVFNTSHSKVILFDEREKESELRKYFSQNIGEKIFINDIVFIEEHKDKFDKAAISKEVDRDTMLVFPIINTEGKTSGLCLIGKKPFGDFYTKNEIKALFSLMKFLGLHTKYVLNYTKIQDLSLHLDARIDEKTLEYNDLINQQKEFISMISHEIRSPIGSTIFQIDSLANDIEKNTLEYSQVGKAVQNIGSQLADIGELLKKLFSIQYFDTRTVTLLKEKIHIGTLLEKEFDIYSHMYEDITFIKKISPHIGFIDIDKIHFHQVLINLLENAMKFADPRDPTILIECGRTEHGSFYMNIEDNGPGYGDVDPETIFEKYSTSNHSKIGLGLGLYLCKRIITMHGGTIKAGIGKTLPGASFRIEMPQ